MSWNGAGTFNRLFSWQADKAAGLDISASRMDADTNNITSIGLGNCITRDGQGQPTANLPMAGFRHTGVQNAVNRTDYAAFGQVQDGLPNWTVAGGSADAITATYTPALGSLSDGQLCFLRVGASNATTTPTFSPNSLTARTITKLGGAALSVADIPGNLAEIILRYNAANTRWELLNPATPSIPNGFITSLMFAAGAVVTAAIGAAAVTYAKIQNVTAARLLGNPTGGAAAPSEISLGTGLSFSGSTLNTAVTPAGVPNYISGLILSTAGSSGTFGISAGAANDSTNVSLMQLASAYTKTTASWVVGSGNGGLDTGAIANGTWYHEYLIQRPDTGVVDVIFSLSATSPTLPANYTLFRRVGSMKTDASAHWLAFTQFSDEFIWAAQVTELSAQNNNGARVSLTLAGVPTGIVVMAHLRLTQTNGAGGAMVTVITSLFENDVSPAAGDGDMQANASQLSSGNFDRLTNTSAQFGFRTSSTNGTVSGVSYGWRDYRGK